MSENLAVTKMAMVTFISNLIICILKNILNNYFHYRGIKSQSSVFQIIKIFIRVDKASVQYFGKS